MSRLRRVELPCRCGHMQPARVADSINVTRSPSARAALLDGTLHCFECDACGAELTWRGPLLYTDVERQQCVLCRLPEEADDWASWAAVIERGFWRPFPHAGNTWRRDAEGYTVRLVFGLWALREKILAWAADIDDAVLEVLKLDLRLRQGVAGVPCLTAVDADTLSFRSPAEPGRVLVPREVLSRLAAQRGGLLRRYPLLFGQVFTDHRRALPGVAPTLEMHP